MTAAGEDASVSATRTAVVKVRLREEELRFLQDVAREDDRSVSSVLRLALKEFYEKRASADVLS